VINLGVWEKAGVERKFRLTEESMASIDPCLGMRTYEEASSLFTEITQLEPWGGLADDIIGCGTEFSWMLAVGFVGDLSYRRAI